MFKKAGLSPAPNKKVRMKPIFFVTLISILAAHSAQAAGGVSGGGANAVVCRDPMYFDKQPNKLYRISSVELLDLYEGRIENNLTYSPERFPKDHLKGVMEKFRRLIATDEQHKKREYLFDAPVWFLRDVPALGTISVENHYKQISDPNKFVVLPHGTKLGPLDDSRETIVPQGCKIERVALFKNGKIFVDKEIFEAMDGRTKDALIFHEAAYKYHRELYGETDSRSTRYLVANLMSEKELKPVIDGVDSYTKFCRQSPFGKGGAKVDKSATEFFVSTNPVNEKITIQFTRLIGKPMYAKTTVEFPAPRPDGLPTVGKIRDAWQPLPPMTLSKNSAGGTFYLRTESTEEWPRNTEFKFLPNNRGTDESVNGKNIWANCDIPVGSRSDSLPAVQEDSPADPENDAPSDETKAD